MIELRKADSKQMRADIFTKNFRTEAEWNEALLLLGMIKVGVDDNIVHVIAKLNFHEPEAVDDKAHAPAAVAK